jgi:hypothetical protein
LQREAAAVPQFLINRSVKEEAANRVKEYIRTYRVHAQFRAGDEVHTQVERDLRALLSRQPTPGPVRVRFDPSGTRVERLEGLGLPSRGPTLREDARRAAFGDLKPLIGPDALIVPVESEDPNAPQQRFEQHYQVGKESLPLLGRGYQLESPGVSLYYDRSMLVSVSNDTIRPEDLRFDSTVKDEGPRAAEQRVKSALNLPASVVMGPTRKGIYVDFYRGPDNLGPAYARIAD